MGSGKGRDVGRCDDSFAHQGLGRAIAFALLEVCRFSWNCIPTVLCTCAGSIVEHLGLGPLLANLLVVGLEQYDSCEGPGYVGNRNVP